MLSSKAHIRLSYIGLDKIVYPAQSVICPWSFSFKGTVSVTSSDPLCKNLKDSFVH